jgi:hypothetical protein
VITAASWGHVDALEVLLTTGKADVSSNWKWEVSPLACAAREGRRKIAECLIRHDVDVNAIDESGNDPLIVAWEKNHPEIAFYLVENGAVLKDVRSWALLANFPAAAFQIANGFASHHMKTIEHKARMNNGILNSKDKKPAVRIPHETICTWLEKVPSALLVLLDKLFTQAPVGVPVRSDMKGYKIRTQYVEKTEEWKPFEEPKLLELCPTDDDGVGGKAVIVRCLHQTAILQTSYFFALINSSLGHGLLASESIQNTVQHTWTNVVFNRFVFDFVFHVLAMLGLFMWTMTLILNHEPQMALSGFSFLVILTLYDTYHFYRQYSYYNEVMNRPDLYKSNIWSVCGFDIKALVRMLAGYTTFALALNGKIWELDYVDKAYRLPLSISALLQFFQIFQYLRGMEAFGVTMIPMLDAMGGAGVFFLPIFLVIFAMVHATASMGGNVWRHFLGHFELIIVQKMNPDAEEEVYNAEFAGCVVALNYIMSLFLGLLFYNTIVPVIMERFEFERERRFEAFIRERIILCWKYMLATDFTMGAPMDVILHKIAPAQFPTMEKTGILWTSETMDYRKKYDARLKWIHNCMVTTIDDASKKLHDRSDEMEFDLVQKMERTHTMVEQYRSKLTKSIKREEKKLKGSMNRSAYKEIEEKAAADRAVDSVYIRNADQDWMHEGDADAIAIRGSIGNVLAMDEAKSGLMPHQAKEAGNLQGAAAVAQAEKERAKKERGSESRSMSRASSTDTITQRGEY